MVLNAETQSAPRIAENIPYNEISAILGVLRASAIKDYNQRRTLPEKPES